MTSNKKPSLLGWLLAAVVFGVGGFAENIVSQEARIGAQQRESYFPLAIGNRWTYVYSENPRMAGKTLTWKVTDQEVRNAAHVYYVSSTPSQGEDEPLLLSSAKDGIEEVGTGRFLIKDPIHPGDHWKVVDTSPRFKGKLDVFGAVSVGKPCSVGGRVFDDCVIIQETVEAINTASLTTYARSVGPVKYLYFKGLHSREVESTLTIKSWEVH
jgi:hypothetical protein